MTSEPAPTSSDAVADLLGVLAYAELTAFVRVAEDADMAPTLAAKAALGRIAVTEFAHFEALVAGLEQRGADPEEAMTPFVAPIDAFHTRTAPNDWLESLVKAYVGEGIATDFYREIAEYVDAGTRDLVHQVLADTGQAEFAVTTVRAAIEQDPTVAGRLALWGRRLVGEALSQAQRVTAVPLMVNVDSTICSVFTGRVGSAPVLSVTGLVLPAELTRNAETLASATEPGDHEMRSRKTCPSGAVHILCTLPLS